MAKTLYPPEKTHISHLSFPRWDMGVSSLEGMYLENNWVFRCFLKWWYPQIIHLNRVFHYKPSILGYPYFWKHPTKPQKPPANSEPEPFPPLFGPSTCVMFTAQTCRGTPVENQEFSSRLQGYFTTKGEKNPT